MADYSAVLRNALNKIDATDDVLRQGIYQKARDSIARKIEALPKQPPQAAIDAQFAKLDAAIAEVEADFAPLADMEPTAEPELEVPTIDAPPEPEAEPDVEPEAEPQPEPIADEADSVPSPEVDALQVDDTVTVPDIDDGRAALDTAAETITEKASDPLLDFLDESNSSEFTEPLDPVAPSFDDGDFSSDDAVDRAIAAVPELADSVETVVEADTAPFETTAEKPAPRWGLLGGIVVVAGVIGGLGYAAYTNQDQLRDLIGMPAVEDTGVPVRTVPSTVVEPSSVGAAETEEDTTQPVAVESATEQDTTEKFTQRLTEDGTEVDEGPVGGNVELGEGSSVSTQSEGTAEPETETAQEADGDGTAPEAEIATPLPVGQRALFYEERTGSQAGTSFPGAAIWSVVQQEPAPGLALEPAIRVEASVPDLGIVLEMIIKRNGDDTLPASHIAELFFRVPATFEGRGIADVQRLTLKEAESDPGNALIAVPAPIDTNIFLIALNNSDTAVASNVALLKERDWLDIPMQYISGRRALITLEKGSGGRAVFDEVFAAWDANPL